MSQSRMRKASAVGDVPRVRSTVVKASGDSSGNPNQQKQSRSRSKNKIPRQIRYDLDNALVGLCDVWFEDIKPHLLRNNIKVHIHGEGSSPASGDHQRPPAGTCSHLDPGAASDNYQQECKRNAKSANTSKTQKSRTENQQSYQRQGRRSHTYTLIPNTPVPRDWQRKLRPVTAPCKLNKGSQTYFRFDIVKRDRGFNHNYKDIEVLYHSPCSSESNSSTVSLETPRGERKRRGTGKLPPWR